MCPAPRSSEAYSGLMAITITRPKAKKPKRPKKGSNLRAKGTRRAKSTTIVVR